MQEINLYLPEFRPKRELVTMRNSLIALVVMIVALSANWITKQSALGAIQKQVVELESQSKSLNAEVETLKKLPKKVVDRSGFEKKLDEVRADLINRKGLLKVMSGESFGNRVGFSARFKALSQEVPDGVSLVHFAFDNGGRRVEIEGASDNADKVPLYIGRLLQQTEFLGAEFGQLSLSGRGKVVGFRIGDPEKKDSEGEKKPSLTQSLLNGSLP